MRPPSRFKRAGAELDQRIDTALAAGVVLRFTGALFEETGRPRGTGPTYATNAVLRRVRAGKAALDTRGEDPGHYEIHVKALKRAAMTLAYRADVHG
jgi:hypothetical protein